MTHQVASAVVSVPLETLEPALHNVEDWTSFIVGVSAITKRAHERYVFALVEGAGSRDVPTVVRHDHKNHCFMWHAVSGPRFVGSLKLTAIDAHRTRLTLDLTAHPYGFMASVTDMVAHNRSQAALDIQRLQSYAAQVAATAQIR